jgi:hypothetical protein
LKFLISLVDIRGRNLQVIVKLANIELTPENPKYSGGSWHVEVITIFEFHLNSKGMQNENIVASGIYYYHSENISSSYLSFRVATGEPNYEQSDDFGVKEVSDINFFRL